MKTSRAWLVYVGHLDEVRELQTAQVRVKNHFNLFAKAG